ncbi:MAG: AAA family ATPase [Candidatus Babeliales bacterium]
MTILKRIQILVLLFPVALVSAMAKVDEKIADDAKISTAWTLILNGTSSSGKSTLAKKLQKIVKQPIEILQLDSEATQVIKEMLEAMGHHYDGKTEFWEWFNSLPEDIKSKIDESDDVWESEATKRLIEKAKKLVSEGTNVIIDTVFENENEYTRFKKELNCERTYFVLVYAPMVKLLENVLERNSSGNKSEERDLSMPFGQYLFEFYQPCNLSFPQKLDVLTRKDFDAVCQQLERHTKNQDQEALKKAREDKEKVAHTFFGDKNITGIALKLPPHDFVIHTGTASPTKCAKTLAAWLAGQACFAFSKLTLPAKKF